jgi:hypothetical protein
MIEERAEMDTDMFLKVVRVALDVLSRRILHLMTALLSAVMFCWVMAQPDTTRLGGAIAFSCLMIVLTYISGGKNES